MFTIGTGVGGGIVIDGRVLRGATGAPPSSATRSSAPTCADGAVRRRRRLPAARLARVAGRPGRALDRLALESARAHPKSFLGRRLAGRRDHRPRRLEGAREGDVALPARDPLLGERLGIGIANAINTFDPDVVVVGGGVSPAGDLLLGRARARPRASVPGVGTQTKIRLARYGPQAGVRGAALLAGQEWPSARGEGGGR